MNPAAVHRTNQQELPLTDAPSPMHQPVDCEEECARWRRLLSRTIDLKRELRRLAFGGFDSFADYVAYGEMFIPSRPRSEYPPESRKYYIRDPDPNK